ncbi:hypothetical protein LTR70_005232 [Exophiala xenobiotica]|uniref:Uncharacterized protein n=1 Tax=Lithohypha guttulata TaxID=1690604 RepID=A0ABR0KBM5_9EURO|nr:hypothetical protein LTR24_004963 [Lithohypha guttulata]KAK5318797.1 hypothetical protein LTR70_005232 [Exophiala xenobiotica]
MGIPYSKQINAAFDQVTPLVAEGFEVLQTTKNISLFLAVCQVLTAIFLALILVTLQGLLIAVNPDLEYERQEIVTPAVKWLAGWILVLGQWKKSIMVMVLVVVVGCAVGSLAGIWYTATDPTMNEDLGDGTEGEDPEALTGEDIEAIKKGETKQ